MIRKTLRLTPADRAACPYAYVPIDVPEGTTRLDVSLAYDKTDTCIVDLGCADPRLGPFPARNGFRGWSGGARAQFFVATDDATPGYVPGPMPSGEWQVILGLYKIPSEGAEVTITARLDNAPRATLASLDRPHPVRTGAGWYRGDLHCHTFHSDAAGDPATLHAAARQAGLDFLAVSDHNTITQRRYFDPASSSDLVFIRAMEVTTAEGHANAFGTDGWIDFRMTGPSDAHRVADQVHAGGGIFSINHDKPGLPWTLDWPEADCMEVWQHPWLAWNWVSLDRWQRRLASGLRLPAIGGSDWHQPVDLHPEGPFALARPTTVFHLPELSEDAILKAMRTGRGYVTEAPGGPHLELTLGGVAMGGVSDGGVAEIAAHGAEGDTLTLHDATGEIARMTIPDDDATMTPEIAPCGFLRAEITAEASRDRLLSEFHLAFPDGLPWGLTEDEIAQQPLRRALSNPVWLAA